MMLEKVTLVLLATLTPVSELRGGIPLGLSLGLDPIFTLFIAVLANTLLFLPVFLGLELFYERLLSKWKPFHLYLKRVRKKGQPWVERYGFLGLTLFVAVPLPASGVYTGTTLSWLLGMDRRKAFLAVCLGVTLAGVVVLLTTLGIMSGIKNLL